jgi:hypothetical protein
VKPKLKKSSLPPLERPEITVTGMDDIQNAKSATRNFLNRLKVDRENMKVEEAVSELVGEEETEGESEVGTEAEVETETKETTDES